MVHIERRSQTLVNIDPQRRCYNGCHAKSELRWGPWEVIDWDIAPERIEERLKFWNDLSDYAVSQRGEGARSEYRVTQPRSEK